MNRKQAENILSAYVLLSTTNEKEVSDSLREVILDAMTSYQNYPITISNPVPRIDPCKHLVTLKSEVETGQMEVDR